MLGYSGVTLESVVGGAVHSEALACAQECTVTINYRHLTVLLRHVPLRMLTQLTERMGVVASHATPPSTPALSRIYRVHTQHNVVTFNLKGEEKTRRKPKEEASVLV